MNILVQEEQICNALSSQKIINVNRALSDHSTIAVLHSRYGRAIFCLPRAGTTIWEISSTPKVFSQSLI